MVPATVSENRRKLRILFVPRYGSNCRFTERMIVRDGVWKVGCLDWGEPLRQSAKATALCMQTNIFLSQSSMLAGEFECNREFCLCPTVIQLLWLPFGRLNGNPGPLKFVRRAPCTPLRSVLESSVNAINRGRIAGFQLCHKSPFDWTSDLRLENSVGDSAAIFQVSLSRESTISPENFICRW